MCGDNSFIIQKYSILQYQPDYIKMTMNCIGSPIYNFININNDNFVFLMYFLDGFMLSEDNKSLYK